MTNTMTVALAQIDLNVGDVVGNKAKILEYAARARDEMQADLVIFPELSVCGYPPEDLLFHAGLRKQTEAAVAEIRDSTRDTAILIGFPNMSTGRFIIAAPYFETAICCAPIENNFCRTTAYLMRSAIFPKVAMRLYSGLTASRSA